VIVTGLSTEPFDVRALTEQIRREDCGALVVFEGTTRSPNSGEPVLSLSYEAWPERAEPQLRDLAQRAVQHWDLGGAVAVHRTGEVAPGETSVVVAASAPHRDEAFAAARWLLDTLKAELAIWKKEITARGETWVGLP